MLRLRLQRRGKKNYATYRLVVANRQAPVKGHFVADVGHYNPHTDVFKVDKDAVQDWLNKGAAPSSTVHNLLVTHGVIKAEKVTSWRPKKKEGGEEAKEETGNKAEESEDTKSKE
jgi:small subunit ribosomal protein S16